jgi:hypothetical protein
VDVIMVELRMPTSCPQPLSSHSHEKGPGDRHQTAVLGTLSCNAVRRTDEFIAVEGDAMTQPTLATQPTITDLLAGVIDLAPGTTPPHRPGPCTALCVPACAGEPATDRPDRPTSATPEPTPHQHETAVALVGPR